MPDAPVVPCFADSTLGLYTSARQEHEGAKFWSERLGCSAGFAETAGAYLAPVVNRMILIPHLGIPTGEP